MRVIRRVTHNNRVKCSCGAILEWDFSDVHTNEIGHGPGPEYIVCPDCSTTHNVTVPRHWLSRLYPDGS